MTVGQWPTPREVTVDDTLPQWTRLEDDDGGFTGESDGDLLYRFMALRHRPPSRLADFARQYGPLGHLPDDRMHSRCRTCLAARSGTAMNTVPAHGAEPVDDWRTLANALAWTRDLLDLMHRQGNQRITPDPTFWSRFPLGSITAHDEVVNDEHKRPTGPMLTIRPRALQVLLALPMRNAIAIAQEFPAAVSDWLLQNGPEGPVRLRSLSTGTGATFEIQPTSLVGALGFELGADAAGGGGKGGLAVCTACGEVYPLTRRPRGDRTYCGLPDCKKACRRANQRDFAAKQRQKRRPHP